VFPQPTLRRRPAFSGPLHALMLDRQNRTNHGIVLPPVSRSAANLRTTPVASPPHQLRHSLKGLGQYKKRTSGQFGNRLRSRATWFCVRDPSAVARCRNRESPCSQPPSLPRRPPSYRAGSKRGVPEADAAQPRPSRRLYGAPEARRAKLTAYSAMAVAIPPPNKREWRKRPSSLPSLDQRPNGDLGRAYRP